MSRDPASQLPPEAGAASAAPSATPSVRAFFLRGVSGTAVTSAATVGLALVTTAFLASRMGASGYGSYAWALAWVFTLRVPAMLGTDRLVTREIAAHRATRSGPEPADVLAWADRGVLGAALPLAALVALLALLFHGSGHHLTSYLALAMTLLPFATIELVRQSALLADQRVMWGLLPDTVVRPALLLILVVGFSLLSAGRLTAGVVVLAHLAAVVVALAVALAGSRRAFGPLRWKPRAPRPRGWYASGARISATNSLLALALQMDLVVLGALRGPRDAGIYAVATRGATLVNLPGLCALPALSPVIATLYASGERERLQRALTRITRWVFAGAVVAAIAVALAAGPLLRLLGHGFAEGETAVLLLLVVALITNLTGFNATILTLTGQERPAMWASVAGMVAALAVALVLIPVIGVAGAAAGAIARAIVRSGGCAVVVWRRLGIDSTILGARPGAAREAG